MTQNFPDIFSLTVESCGTFSLSFYSTSIICKDNDSDLTGEIMCFWDCLAEKRIYENIEKKYMDCEDMEEKSTWPVKTGRK